MRRRLIVVIAGAVAAAVTVVGLGTLILTRLTAQNRNEDDLAEHVEALAGVISEVRPARVGPVTERLEPALDVDTVRLVRLDRGPPPPLDTGEVERLRAADTVSGRSGDTAYAAAALPSLTGRPPVRAVLATDSTETDAGPAGGWFVVAGAVTVALGALVALWVARSLAGPLAQAEAATRRIAEGDLAARVPEPGPDGAEGNDDELTRLVHSINAMAASLERARRTERDFLLSVSHDLRTPLTSIGGWAEALTDGTAPDPRTAGATILAESGRLDRLVRDLLDLARLRAQAFTLEPRPVDLRDVAAGAAEALRPDLEDAGLVVAVDLPPDPVMVVGDTDRLAQIAGNLIENAGRYAATRVLVSVSAPMSESVSVSDTGGGTPAALAVEDDGPGIPPEEQARVFERLHSSVRPAARPGTGTGLGLAIVRELAGAMGGDVVATDAPGGGARLTVRLPRLPA